MFLIETYPYRAYRLSTATQDAIIRNLPEMYGFICYAKPSDEFMATLERFTQKRLYSLSKFLDLNSDNFKQPPHQHDFILSFNVIEKLMNPLYYLIQLRDALRPDGKLILSTSIDLGIWQKDSFREFDKNRLCELLNVAGFESHNIKKIRVPWWRMFDSLLKWPVGQYWYVEAVK